MLVLDTNSREIGVRYDQAQKLLPSLLYKTLQRVGAHLQRAVIARLRDASAPKVRTGNLSRSTFVRIETSGNEILVRVGVDLMKAPQGRIQELGGTVVPTRAKYLTVPVGQALTAAGVMRVNARQFITNPASLHFVGSFVNPRRTAIMGVRTDGSAEPVFALKTRVQIKPTGYLSKTAAQEKAWILDQVGMVVPEALA